MIAVEHMCNQPILKIRLSLGLGFSWKGICQKKCSNGFLIQDLTQRFSGRTPTTGAFCIMVFAAIKERSSPDVSVCKVDLEVDEQFVHLFLWILSFYLFRSLKCERYEFRFYVFINAIGLSLSGPRSLISPTAHAPSHLPLSSILNI